MTDNHEEAVRYWWHMAQESLASARREFAYGAYSFAINRLYYMAFYAASAALFDRHLTFLKHSGVRAAFHRHFIKTGLMDRKFGLYYDELFQDRQEGDYLAFSTFEEAYVEEKLSKGDAFLRDIQDLIHSLSSE